MQVMIFAADNDRLTAGNPGVLHATAAATAIGAGLIVPQFPGDIGTDFNDLMHISGLAAVRTMLEAITKQAAVPTVEHVVRKYELRPYQSRLIEDVRQHIQAGHRSILVASPTGSGKAVMLTRIIELCYEKGSSVLFLVHRQEILYQIADYLDNAGIEYGLIKAGEKHEDHHPIQLAMFQTIARRLNNPYIKQADVIIIDECHHATAETFLKSIKTFRKPQGIILGFSATPARKTGLGLGNLFDVLIQVATIRQLTDLGYLAPVRIFGPVQPDLNGVKVTAGDYNNGQLEVAMNKAQVVGDVVGHYEKYGQGRKAVCFAVTVTHAVALLNQFLLAGITAAVVSAKTPKNERNSIIARFKAGIIQVIINCQVLTEGIDVPDIGCVILARPTKSLVMYLQMVGRGMRVIPGKTDCILLDHAGAVHEHGFPDEITEWELSSDDKTINKKQAQRKIKESEPIGCPVCGLLYTAQLQCPGCGNIPTLKQIGKDIEYDLDRVLGEIVRKPAMSAKKVKEPTGAEKEAFYRELLCLGLDRGYSRNRISQLFRSKFKVWPNKYANMPPAQEVSPEVRNHVHAHNRAYATAMKMIE